jgi:hypothetical protein
MDRGVAAAVRPLPESDRKDLAIQALARSETVSDLAARHGVSRKFVYQQVHKACAALDDAFSSATMDSEVLFELAVTKAWLRQVIVALPLICRSSYRGGLSGILCLGPYDAVEGAIVCRDANSPPSRMSCWTSCWAAAIPGPPWPTAACWTGSRRLWPSGF